MDSPQRLIPLNKHQFEFCHQQFRGQEMKAKINSYLKIGQQEMD